LTISTVPKYTASSLISVVEWISDNLIAVSTLDYKIDVVNVETGEVLFYYNLENEGVKSMKYYNNHLVFYQFNGDVGIVNQNFILEKSVKSAEKKIDNMDIEEEIDIKDLENVVFNEEFKAPEPM